MRRIKYSTKSNQIKVEKTRFGKVNSENDVIHDGQKVIWNINFKKIRRYWHKKYFSLKSWNCVGFFRWCWAGDIGPPCKWLNYSYAQIYLFLLTEKTFVSKITSTINCDRGYFFRKNAFLKKFSSFTKNTDIFMNALITIKYIYFSYKLIINLTRFLFQVSLNAEF